MSSEISKHSAPPPPPAGAPTWRKTLSRLGPIGIVLLFALGKAKFALGLLKFAKLGTLVSMFVAVWAYALFWGWPFAVGFVLLIFVHELGHAAVMTRLGIRAGAPVFIPFVGAVIAMRSLPKDAYVEALVALGGPILGSVGALACLGIAYLTGDPFWYALASTGFLINLFNLIPISPLDGGRIVGVVNRWIWLAGYAIGIAMFFVTYSPILLLVMILGLFRVKDTIRGPSEDYYRVDPAKRWTIGLAYFVLLGALAVGMWVSDRPLRGLHALPVADVAGEARPHG
jgi:Zn-dependent protease